MTLLLAVAILLSIPVFVALLKGNERNRLRAYSGIALVPLLAGAPVQGYLYGWPLWHGTVLGFAVTFGDALAIALLLTRRERLKKQIFWPVFLFYGFSLFTSIFGSVNWTATAFVWWQFARMLLLFTVVAGEGHRLDVRNSLLTGLALGLFYQAAYVITQKLTGQIQANGTFASQNLFGMVLELSILPLVGAALGGYKNKFIVPGALAGLICVAGTGSRAATVFTGAAILGLLIASLVRQSTPRKMKAIGFAVLGLAIASPLALMTLNQRFEGGSYVTEEDTRESFENAARSMAADYPFGVGANMFVWVSIQQDYAERAGVSWLPQNRSKPVHNAYLLARAETGWLGEVAIILMLVVPLLTAFRTAFADRRNPTGELALGISFALLTNIIHNNWEFDLHSAAVQSLLFLNFGLIAAMWRQTRTRDESLSDDVDGQSAQTRRAVTSPPVLPQGGNRSRTSEGEGTRRAPPLVLDYGPQRSRNSDEDG
ncbi:O-antigen ligase family protein [Qipengyuania atrilutea]|uniref:O-antigen ligase family protein n=1 Tax=Qipengyuania atrilutea TaxID=2744473 RepID=A0A850H6E1_9SPHN|nr:O-antigen ligase family protein [Actirhodobacter atriluteus]NVD45408.1 O-antigen ligase family protein [Actirhodobacter atriluteus]